LWIHEDDLVVGTHGRSFWILDDISLLRQLGESTAHSDAVLFTPAAAIRVRRSTNTDTPLPPDEPTAQNPPDGAAIDYYLGKEASGPIAVEILDASGELVRRYSSADKPATTDEELAKQIIPLYWIRKHKPLSTSAGMHRWMWDLHYPSPAASRYEYPSSAIPGDTPRGPLGARALPGRYTVKLTVNGKTYSEPLIIKMDPRVKTSREGLAQMFKMQLRLAAMMTEASHALAGARSVREQLQKLNTSPDGALATAVSDFGKKLSAVLDDAGTQRSAGQAATPTLVSMNGGINTLYSEVDRADAAPTAAQHNALSEVEGVFADVMKRWRALEATDMPVLNQHLRQGNLPEVHSAAESPREEEDADDIE